MFRATQFFIEVAIGMVLEPPHQGVGSTYLYGVEGNFVSSLNFFFKKKERSSFRQLRPPLSTVNN